MLTHIHATHGANAFPQPSTPADVKALQLDPKTERSFAAVVAHTHNCTRVGWRHFLDFLGLDSEVYLYTEAGTAAEAAATPSLMATPAPVPAAAAAPAAATAAVQEAKKEEEEAGGKRKGSVAAAAPQPPVSPSPIRHTLHHHGAAGGGLSDHIRDAFVVWLQDKGRGFGRATAELTCQV